MTLPTRSPNESIQAIQVARLLAAALVVLDHFLFALKNVGLYESSFAIDGRLGVDIFFVISGFIMVHISSVDDRWSTRPGPFLLRRWLRIAPAYYVATLTFVGMFLAADHAGGHHAAPVWNAAKFVKSALFIPYFEERFGLPQPALGQGWTLNYEMFFYVVFAAVLFLRRTMGLVILAMTFIVLAAAGQIWDVSSGDAFVLTHRIATPIEPAFVVPRFWLHPIILEFLAGVGIAVLRERVMRLGVQPKGPDFLAAAGFIIVITVVLSNEMGGASHFVPMLRTLAAVVIVSIAVLTRAAVGDGAVGRFLVSMGDSSYSLYLFHYHLIFVLPSVCKRLPPAWRFEHRTLTLAVLLLAGVCASLLLARLSYRFLERPLSRARVHRRASSGTAPPLLARPHDGHP